MPPTDIIRAVELAPTEDGAPHADWPALLALGPDLAFISEPPGIDNDPAVQVLRASGATLVPHLTTRNRRPHDVAERVGTWRGQGVNEVFALRGDAVTACDLSRDQRLRSGAELTRLLRGLDASLGVWVAGYPETHPEASSPEADLRALLAKVEAGATGIVAQFTFTADAHLAWRDRCHAAGIALPTLAGLLPIADAAWLVPFAEHCGASVPPQLARALERWRDDDASLAAFGLDYLTEMGRRLLAAEVDGVTLFTRNRAADAAALWNALGLSAS
jgi:methylenetetrahydrofolate reductase (NADPH)